MLSELKHQVLKANLDLPRYGLVTFTWGNASAADRDAQAMVIKPSGVTYEQLSPDDMVVLDLETGNVIEGKLKPSSDTATHLEIYRAFSQVGGVVHTHSEWATSWAQARRSIPPFGTTHADYFYGEIPCTRELSPEEVENDYEANTGHVIIETIKAGKVDPLHLPGVLVANHGPFTWGASVSVAVHNAVVLDEVAKMAWRSLQLETDLPPIPAYLMDKHYLRKHGKNAYYGQNQAVE